MGERVLLKDVLTIVNGKNQRAVENPSGEYPIYGSGGVMGHADQYICDADTVVIGRKGNINTPIYVTEPFWNVDTAFGLAADKSKLLPKYLYHFCRFFDFEQLNSTVTIPSLTKKNLEKVEIPLPAVEEQDHIVQLLDGVESQSALARQMIATADELIQSRFVEMFGDPVENPNHWGLREIKSLYTVTSAKRIYAQDLEKEGIPFLKLGDLTNRITSGLLTCSSFVNENAFKSLVDNHQVPTAGDVLVTARGTMGLCYEVRDGDRFYFQDGMITWLKKIEASPNSVFFTHLFALPSFHDRLIGGTSGTTISYLSIKTLGSVSVIIPPISLQNEFAAFVAKVESLKADAQQQLDRLDTLYASLAQRYFAQ
ncbi:restriction endonuclease subunit S [Bifidobacterium stellenboschense]|uniref:Type I restriction-modification system specificity subunit n=1 Tax=Bifidobacterium stellenboschense TaxID=762211 RepID=A0A087DGF0_9BIFI|nr:restriction endonuclease subunit S [Bifidobacterium stellenboschense]KFI94600.1 type I restriction-modification system specificity subunit [Bifidobacterium stellenboschense]